MLTVSDDEIASVILTLMEKQKLVAEGAGAAGVAAVLAKKLDLAGKKVCAVVFGGNIDVNILSRVINRGLLSSGRVGMLKIAMLDKPGQLREVSGIIADYGANVIQVRHDPGGEHADMIGCFLHIKMETRNREQLLQIRQAITEKGYKILD
jgi:threonine dehydratase